LHFSQTPPLSRFIFPFPARRSGGKDKKRRRRRKAHGAERVANRTRDIKRLWKERVQLVLARLSPGEPRRARGTSQIPKAIWMRNSHFLILAQRCDAFLPAEGSRRAPEANGAWRGYATRRAGVHSGCIPISVQSMHKFNRTGISQFFLNIGNICNCQLVLETDNLNALKYLSQK